MVTGHPPWPTLSGGQRREFELLRRLADRYAVEVCALDKNAAPGTSGALPTGPAGGQVFATVRAAEGADLEARHRSPDARAWIEGRLDQGDVTLVHCEGYFLHQLLPGDLSVPVVIGAQNVEWELVEQRLLLDGHRPATVGSLLRDLRNRELEVLRTADAVVCVTERDARVLRRHGLDPFVIPDGCDHLPVEPSTPRRVDILLPGNFGYAPNRDAAEAFCADVLPQLRAMRPGITMRIVGNHASRELGHLASTDVEVIGPVSSLAPHLSAASVVAVPLRIGGGIKVKILEALHAGAAVVCTPVAAMGFEDHDGALVVVHRWADLHPRISALLEHPEQLAAQRCRGARYAQRLPRWNEMADQLGGLWGAICDRVTEGALIR